MYWLVKIFCYIFVKLFYPTKVINKSNIKKDENYIFICNHRSNFDVVCLMINLPKKLNFLAKKELASSKTKKKFFSSLGAIFIDRDNIDLTAIKQSINLLKAKKNLVIFPEGTRKNADNMDEIKSGAAMLSIKTKTRILPLFLEFKPRFLKRNKLVVGKAFSLEEYYEEKLTKEVLSLASEKIAKHVNELIV